MKRIRAFHFNLDGFSIDLQDAPRAVEVLTPSGDVILREGTQPDRLHNVLFPGARVLDFSTDRGEAETLVRFCSIGPEGERVYDLGTTPDAASAERWVERVNKVYVERRGALSARTEGFRTGVFKHEPVVHDVLETGEARVLPEIYTYSGLDPTQIPRTLEPWERFFCERQIVHLRAYTGYTGQIKIQPLTRVQHNYRWLERNVKYSKRSFGHRVTQALDLIFDREERHGNIGVVHAGDPVERFALVYLDKSSAQRALGLVPDTDAKQSFSEWIAAIRATADDRDSITVCTPASHSVDYSIYNATVGGDLSDDQHDSESKPGSLAQWLHLNDRRGVIACDIGWAYEIERLYMALHPGRPIHHSFVPYDTPVPIGFCYRADDPTWCRLVGMALAECLDAKDPEIRASFQSFRSRALRVGIRIAA